MHVDTCIQLTHARAWHVQTHILFATCYEGARGGSSIRGTVVSRNEILLAPPGSLHLPAAVVSASVAAAPGADGSIDVHLEASATALFVTLTTLAAGRFSDNAFALRPGKATVQFLPLGGARGAGASGGAADRALLASSLRVEHLQQNMASADE